MARSVTGVGKNGGGRMLDLGDTKEGGGAIC